MSDGGSLPDQQGQPHVRRPRQRGGKRAQREHRAVAKHQAAGTWDPSKAGKSGLDSAKSSTTKNIANRLLLEHWSESGPAVPFPKAVQDLQGPPPSSAGASGSDRRATLSSGFTSSASETLAIPISGPPTPRGKPPAPPAPLYLESSSQPRAREPAQPLPTVPKAALPKSKAPAFPQMASTNCPH